jgi:hypothetical protein
MKKLKILYMSNNLVKDWGKLRVLLQAPASCLLKTAKRSWVYSDVHL